MDDKRTRMAEELQTLGASRIVFSQRFGEAKDMTLQEVHFHNPVLVALARSNTLGALIRAVAAVVHREAADSTGS